VTRQPMARPFPQPGALVGLAFRELRLAASGTLEQSLPFGDLYELPRPWEPESCPAMLRGEIWAWLDQVVDWLNTDYCWDPDGLIPTCWPHHPHLVHEIAVLADQRRIAGQAFTSDLLEEWHRYTLPSFHDRLRSRIRSHCDDSHQPWPAKGRQTRYRDGADDRSRRFADDLLSSRGEGVSRTTAQLALIDLTTGEITT
jgi:hypothetical protein